MQVVKPFLDPKTHKKVKFVYSGEQSSRKIMEDLFNMDELETAFGGNNQACFNITDYAAMMREDDKRMPLFYAGGKSSEPSAVPSLNVNSESDKEKTTLPERSAPNSLEELSINCGGNANVGKLVS